MMGENPPQQETDSGGIPGRSPEPGEPASPGNTSAVNTGGGAAILGGVTIQDGDFIGRDKIVITDDKSHDVGGLPNPYLGLRAFAYADRTAFAGRDQSIHAALAQLTTPGAKQALLFICGASGCGKSSFVLAGLLPALITHYQERYQQVCHASFRPSSNPLAMLEDALLQLGLPDVGSEKLANLTPDQFARFIVDHTPATQINLLVIDQFEEFFTQSQPNQRDWMFSFLSELPSFENARLHMIATLRSDYLPELFNIRPLYDLAKSGIDLRAMDQKELRDAIQRPLQAAYPDGSKRLEPELVDRLAADAAGDAAYLPLLQVTLEQLWNKGRLVLGAYANLTDAIKQRADNILVYQDYNASLPSQPRSKADQDEMLAIFLDLVNVSLDDDFRRDVRRRRLMVDLERNSARRRTLIADLIAARLLSVATEAQDGAQVETVDIIHETLINNWDRLREGVAQTRQNLQRRARFEQQLAEWLANGRLDEYLLVSVRLAEARELQRDGDVALWGADANEFLRRSVARVEAAQQHELQLERRAKRGWQGLVGLLVILLLVSISVIIYPYALSFLARGPIVHFPAGKAVLGINNPPPGFSEEGPQREFLLPAFGLERYEVSIRHYRFCVRAGQCSLPADPSQYLDDTKLDFPVVGVSALQANDYCQWLGRHLPTELEWFRAARGTEGRMWPWGIENPTPERANLNFTGTQKSTDPVNSHPLGASPEGVFNLVGNVAEWTASYQQRYNNYDPSLIWNGDTNDLQYERLLALGAGDFTSNMDRVTYRQFSEATSSSPSIGFRCSQ